MNYSRFGVLSAGLLLFTTVSFAQAPPAQQHDTQTAAPIDENIPQLKIQEEILPLTVPGYTIGETEGVSTNSQGHLFVYSRTGSVGIARGGAAAVLFEFDRNHKFVKVWGPGNYAASFAHSVRVDRHGNVWMVDEGSNMIVEFDPQGNVKMVLGRKPEAVAYLQQFLEHGDKTPKGYPVGVKGEFNRETDIAWDDQDNIYITDGYANSRIIKLDKDGNWIKWVGTHGSGVNQFNVPHSIAYADGKLYVADRNNDRIQVYDTDLNYLKTISDVGMPWAVCISPGAKKYLWSGDGDTGKIYKLNLDGKLLGWAQTRLNQGHDFCSIHEMDCASDHVIYRGSCGVWNVDKITVQ